MGHRKDDTAAAIAGRCGWKRIIQSLDDVRSFGTIALSMYLPESIFVTNTLHSARTAHMAVVSFGVYRHTSY